MSTAMSSETSIEREPNINRGLRLGVCGDRRYSPDIVARQAMRRHRLALFRDLPTTLDA